MSESELRKREARRTYPSATPATAAQAYPADPMAPRHAAAAEYVADDATMWASRARVVLTPIAAPSILGLFGFMAATIMVGAWQAGWYGDAKTPLIIFPFAMVFGGLAQLVAAFYSFRARDGVAVGVHGAWGSFWIGWGILQLLVATHVLSAVPLGAYNPSLAMWFVGLTVVTISGALATTAKNLGIAAVLWSLAAGSALTAAGLWAPSLGVLRVGGWLFVISAGLAWYAATAMMLEGAYGRTILPMGKFTKAANIPGRSPSNPIEYPAGMPGVRVGQ